MTIGIYKLCFTGTSGVYIGSSVNIEARWRQYTYGNSKRILPIKLQEAFDRYSTPVFSIIEECSADLLFSRENFWIKEYDAIHSGFNSREGGNKGYHFGAQGELNGRAVYTNEQVLETASYIAYTDYSYPQISSITGVSEQCVSQLAIGVRHTWIQKQFPEVWADMQNNKRSRGTKFTTHNVVRNTGSLEEHPINSINELVLLTSCGYSAATNFLSGRAQSLTTTTGTWVLKNKIKKPAKKPTYTLYNIECDFYEEVYSLLNFINKYELVNRKKWSAFLKQAVIGSEYAGWVIKDIS